MKTSPAIYQRRVRRVESASRILVFRARKFAELPDSYFEDLHAAAREYAAAIRALAKMQ